MADFTTVENQRIISIKGKEARDTNNIYAKINIEAMNKAMRSLKPRTFQTWLYLAKNNDNYTFALSPAAAEKETGIPAATIRDNIRTLIKFNYLIQRKDGSNIYDFYELPHNEDDIEIEIQIHKQEETKDFVF